jgi:hypothetical protein
MENPGPRLVTRCAEYFGYTVPWVSTIMNSDAFKAQLGDMNQHADVAVVNDIPAKLRGVACLALDGLAEQLANAVADGTLLQRTFLHESADMALHRLGYAPQKQVAAGGNITQNNTFVAVSSDALASARATFTALGGQTPQSVQPETIIDQTPVPHVLPA